MYGGASYATIEYGGVLDLSVSDRPTGDSTYKKPKILKLKELIIPKLLK